MIAWWTALSFEEQLYLGAALLASAVLILQLLLSLLGAGVIDDMPEAGDGTHGSGTGIFSVRTIAAFFAGLGWVGVIFLRGGGSSVLAASLGSITGLGLMAGTIYVMRSFSKLQDSGTLSYANAIGSVGTVYVTIPPARGPGGQVEVMFQSRTVFAEARCDAPGGLKTGAKVRIVALDGPTTFLVEPL